MKELRSIDLERHVLAGIVRFSIGFADFESIISVNDFVSKTHQYIFSVVKSLILEQKKFDRIILGKKLKDIGCNANEEIPIFDYLETLYSIPIKETAVLPAVKELVDLRVRREIFRCSQQIQKEIIATRDRPLEEVIEKCDSIYNEKINTFTMINSDTEDIFASMEDVIEEIGNNPKNEGYLSPFPRINEQFGSLMRPGNFCVIGARTGVSKTSLGMFILIHMAEKYELPILHIDNNEMSKVELQMRACAMFSRGQIPYFLIESGQWRQVPAFVKIIREEIWPRVKKIKFFYEQVGNKNSLEICNSIKRISYNKIGRGNPFLTHFDYIKGLSETNQYTPEWKLVGQFIGDLKSLIQNELNIPLWTSLQLNRSGTTNNKTSDQLDDSENSFGISDRIIQQASHAFILRNKTMDEIAIEGGQFGNLKMIPLKKRHLGLDFHKVLTPVKLGNKFKPNYYNIDAQSFHFTERGDLWDIAETLKGQVNLTQTNNNPNDGTLV